MESRNLVTSETEFLKLVERGTGKQAVAVADYGGRSDLFLSGKMFSLIMGLLSSWADSFMAYLILKNYKSNNLYPSTAL